MESVTVESRDGVKLDAMLFNPGDPASDLAVVLVHPFTVLAGLQTLLRGIAGALAEMGYRAVTFNRRGTGMSSGEASVMGITEVKDVVAVCRWVSDTFSPHGIVLVGYSTGAPIAGSAIDSIGEVVGFVGLGYPFGWVASIFSGTHHEAILRSMKPRLFIMGRADEFTSVEELQAKLQSASGRVETHLLEGVGHFQMEGPSYDAQMADLIANFADSLEDNS